MHSTKTKTILKFFFAPFLWLFQACSPLGDPVDLEKSDYHYYNSSKSQIRYSPMGNWFELGNTAMKADAQSFVVFSKFLSSDKNDIFFEAYRVEHHKIDLSSFRVKNIPYMNNVGFDQNYVYTFKKFFKNKRYHALAEIIEDANPKTYNRTDWDWANDGKLHFYKNKKLAVDFDSFEVLNDYFVKDSYRVFVRTGDSFEPTAAQVSSFRILETSTHGIDSNFVYWKPFFKNKKMGLIYIPYTKNEEVKCLNKYFLKANGTIYFDGVAREDIDAMSFEIIDHSYSKDAKHVFYKEHIVVGADPGSFKRIEKINSYSDKNGIYSVGKLVPKESNTTQ